MPCFFSSIWRCGRFISQRRASSATVPFTSLNPRSRNSRSASSLAARRERVEAEAARPELLGATRLHTLAEDGLDHYAVAMADPEGNEFDVN